MSAKNVHLIFPRGSGKYDPYHKTIPSGIVYIANALKRIPDINIKVTDENFSLLSLSENDQIVGLSDWYSNHGRCIEIANETKYMNPRCKVVIGGPNGGNLAERILRNHESVDYVVRGDGEEAMINIAENRPPEEIPNLYYRDDFGIRFTFSKRFDMNSNLMEDAFIETQDYLGRFDGRQGHSPFAISSIRGCIKALKKGPCKFCSHQTK